MHEIIQYLNEKTGAKYSHTAKQTVRRIRARFAEKYTVADFKKVIDSKTQEWKDTKLEVYLRPETLFSTKFDSYLNASTSQKSPKDFWELNERRK